MMYTFLQINFYMFHSLNRCVTMTGGDDDDDC